jgi:hypothetical protein
MKAVMESNMPDFLTPDIVHIIFDDFKKINFFTFSINIFAYKLYISAS